MSCNVTYHGYSCECGKDDEEIRLEETVAAITFGRTGLNVEKLAKYLIKLEDRIKPLEDHKEAADDAAEAATHRPSCKCGNFGHY